MNNNVYRNIYLLNIGLGLLILGFIIHYYSYFSKTSKSNFKNVETYIKAFDENFEEESKQIINLLPNISFEAYEEYQEKDYIILTFKNDSLILWNKNIATLSKEYIRRLNNNQKLIQLNNGYYYIHTKNKQIGKHIYTIAGLLPVYFTYEKESKYLKKKFNDDFKLGKLFDFVLKNKDEIPPFTTHINQTNGDYLFSVAINKNELKKYSFLSILLFIAGLIIILLYINNVALDYLQEDKLQLGYGIIVSGIILIGIITLLLDYVPGFTDLQLFDPSLYASSKFSGSLGHLFLSLVLITWLIAFLYRTLNLKPIQNISINLQKALHFGVSLAFALSGIYISKIIASLVIDSTIDFDVFAFLDSSNLNNLLLALLCMILLLTIFYCLFNILQKLNNAIEVKDYYKILSLVAAVIMAFLFDFGLGILLKQSYDYLSIVFAALLIVVSILFQFYRKNESSNFSTNRFFVWLTFGSLFLALYIFVLDNEKEKDQRILSAKQLAKGNNPNIEYQLSSILRDINKDPYLVEFVTSRFILKKTLDDRLIDNYFSDYVSQFEISTNVFGISGYPIKSKGLKEDDLILKIASYGKNTFDPNLTLFRDKANRYQYVGKVVIKKDSIEMGDMYINIEPKSKDKILVYPELMQSKAQSHTIEISNEYSYAFYEKNKFDSNSAIKLTGQNGLFEYPNYFKDRFEIPNEQMVFKDIDGQSHLIYKIPFEDDFYLVLSKNRFNSIKLVSLFSFIYALVILFIGILWLVYTLINALITHNSPFKYFFSSFSNRLNAALVSLLLFSFLLTGAIITYFLLQQFDNYDNSRLLAKKEALETRLKSEIAEQRLKDSDFIVKVSADFKEALAATNTVLSNAEKENQLKKELDNNAKKVKTVLDSLSYSLSKIHGVDVNIFNTDGDLIGSSLRTTINKELSPEKLSPSVLKKLILNDNYETQQSEKIGELAYTSFYFQLKNNINDKLLAIVNIPYYTSTDKTIQNNVSEFILALINVYVFLFILGSLLALLLSKTLTRSLTQLSEKMGSFRLGKKHDPIEWFYDDEIGKLINGYNQMIQEVEISANLLAQSERQTAWREMARQVAHEIKNPLTPMKLSIQHLQRSLKDNNPNIKELTGKVAKTMFEQIENLTNIASQFSSFAKMPEAQNSIINVNELISNVLPLYDEGAESVAVKYNHPTKPYWIYSDKNRLVQVFNNLIKNAIQSIPEDRKGLIDVQSVSRNGIAHISFKDNGSGIPIEIQHKVFTPNFTTKGSGMGLGLAISKQIIEQSRGKIYFETELDKGTTFFIELPITEKANTETNAEITTATT